MKFPGKRRYKVFSMEIAEVKKKKKDPLPILPNLLPFFHLEKKKKKTRSRKKHQKKKEERKKRRRI